MKKKSWIIAIAVALYAQDVIASYGLPPFTVTPKSARTTKFWGGVKKFILAPYSPLGVRQDLTPEEFWDGWQHAGANSTTGFRLFPWYESPMSNDIQALHVPVGYRVVNVVPTGTSEKSPWRVLSRLDALVRPVAVGSKGLKLMRTVGAVNWMLGRIPTQSHLDQIVQTLMASMNPKLASVGFAHVPELDALDVTALDTGRDHPAIPLHPLGGSIGYFADEARGLWGLKNGATIGEFPEDVQDLIESAAFPIHLVEKPTQFGNPTTWHHATRVQGGWPQSVSGSGRPQKR